MWAFVCHKGGSSGLGEAKGKAASLSVWGDKVELRAEVPLSIVRGEWCHTFGGFLGTFGDFWELLGVLLNFWGIIGNFWGIMGILGIFLTFWGILEY